MIQAVVAFSTRRPWTSSSWPRSSARWPAGSPGAPSERDAIPDVSNPQIVLVADWMGHPAPEVAASVTQVLTRALDGVPGLSAVRGSSMSGHGVRRRRVRVADSDLERGRRAIVERDRRA